MSASVWPAAEPVFRAELAGAARPSWTPGADPGEQTRSTRWTSPPATVSVPDRLLSAIRLHAYELAVEVVDLSGFQAGTAVHLGPDIPLDRQAWPVPDYPQLTQGRHQPMAKQQMASQREKGAMEQVGIADVEEDGAQQAPVTGPRGT